MVSAIILLLVGWFLTYKIKDVIKMSKKTSNIVKIVGLVFMLIGIVSFIRYIAAFLGLS